ncbi:MAG: hypothetical protein JXR96_11020 [Deltaproteobacteria bacterium]|nr:hypothetical protein [Deltaproteobacteria bacterium]
MPFEGLTAEDFDAFEPSKWSSNAHNLARLEAKLKLSALGKEVSQELAEALAGREMGLSAERPSIFNQHKVRDLTLFFFRGPEARRSLGAILDRAKSIADNVQDPAPHHKHISLASRLDIDGLQVGLWLHRDAWIDWKNLASRINGYGELEKLSRLLGSLPETIRYATGEGIQPDSPPARSVEAQDVVQGLGTAEPWTLFAELIPRGRPDLASGQLVGRVVDVLGSLIPLERFIAWSPENDFHDLKVVIREHKEKVRKPMESLQRGSEVRVMKGLASGRLGIVESIEKRGLVKVRMGPVVLAVKMEDLARP